MTTLVLSVIGTDRPGLVSALSGVIETHGGSWERSQMARLAGKFAGIVVVSVPDEAVEAVTAALGSVAGLAVSIERADADEPRDTHTVSLHLLGDDRPGIVAEISAALAARGVGIDELATVVREAPMAGGMLFEVDAVLSAPSGADMDDLRAALEQLAGELMVDLALT